MSLQRFRRQLRVARIRANSRQVPKYSTLRIWADELEALCDLADRAYEAASHLRDRERADFADGYDQSATLSAQHAGELEDCLARLDGEVDR